MAFISTNIVIGVVIVVALCSMGAAAVVTVDGAGIMRSQPSSIIPKAQADEVPMTKLKAAQSLPQQSWSDEWHDVHKATLYSGSDPAPSF